MFRTASPLGQTPHPSLAARQLFAVLQPVRASLTAAALFGPLLLGSSAWGDQVGSYSERSLTLGSGTVRIDGGPPDWGYFHPGGHSPF